LLENVFPRIKIIKNSISFLRTTNKQVFIQSNRSDLPLQIIIRIHDFHLIYLNNKNLAFLGSHNRIFPIRICKSYSVLELNEPVFQRGFRLFSPDAQRGVSVHIDKRSVIKGLHKFGVLYVVFDIISLSFALGF
jgi:hypothetical protein